MDIFVTRCNGSSETHNRKVSVKREKYFPLKNQNKLAYYKTWKTLEPNILAPKHFCISSFFNVHLLTYAVIAFTLQALFN